MAGAAVVVLCGFGLLMPEAVVAADASVLPDSPSQVALALAESPMPGAAELRVGHVPAAGRAQSGPSTPNDPASGFAREVTWASLPGAFLKDQESIWLKFPGQVVKGHHWIPLLAVVGGTAGLIFADPHAMPYFRKHARNLDDVNDTFDSPITTGEVILLPVTMLAAGYARHDPYQVSTALLSGEAYADSAVVDLVIKAITHRARPHEVPANGDFHNTFFSGTTSPLKGSSFPSGHSAGAFAVATVIAGRYHQHHWVPVLAYGFATAISLSRITDSSHFPSDVFLGAALGYAVSKYQVIRPQ
ncbi:MAG: hypothetical protein NVSMB62_04940 [Acidobacteriaceae bacterium]